MIIAVPFFGHDPRFLKLLAYWFACYEASGTNMTAVVITDEAPPAGFAFRTVQVDTSKLAHVQRGHPWDRKGAIVAAATEVLGLMLVCDADAFLRGDPEPVITRLGFANVRTRADGWARSIVIHGKRVKQRQAGVMILAGRLAGPYADAFRLAGEGYSADDWREQIAWSILAEWTGLHELPLALNCSHHDPAAAKAIIVHEHGETKWKRIT